MSRKILWHTVAQNKIGGYLFKGDDPLYYGDDPIFRVATIEGPSVLQHGVVGTYTVSGGWDTEQVTYDADGATVGTTTPTGFTLTLDDDSETAAVGVYYEGRLIDTVYVQCAPIAGVITGDDMLEAGSTSVYPHNLGSGVIYSGDLELVSQDDNGVTLRMPVDATIGANQTISLQGKCGAEASAQVLALPACPCEYDHICNYGSPGYGDAPAYLGAKILVMNYNGGHDVYTVTGVDSTADNGSPFLCSSGTVGRWTVVFASGSGMLLIVCSGVGSNSQWHTVSGAPTCYC